MFDLGTIQRLNEAATKRAEDWDTWPAKWRGNRDKFRLPNLGNYVPEGWRRTDRDPLFVDSSGFGQKGEPALTIDEMFDKLTVGKSYAVIEAGQFQVYVAEYEMDE